MLLTECKKYGVEIALRQSISAVAKTENGFSVVANGETLYCTHLVVATGGLSMPGLGATPFGYQIAEQFWHSCDCAAREFGAFYLA